MSLRLTASRVRRGSLAASLMMLVILHAASGFARPCDEDGVDRNGIRLTRSGILTHCDCDGTHQAYEKCVVRRVDKAIERGVVPRACRPRLMGNLRQARCGRPGAVTCCRTGADGTTKAFIARGAAACRPNVPGGQACIAGSATTHGACWSHIDLAFEETACVTSPPCGNGKRDPGEDCDGEPFCNESCSFGYHMCCLQSSPPDGGLECRDFTYPSLGAIEEFGQECHYSVVFAGVGKCSADRQACIPAAWPLTQSLCCQGTSECADDRDTGCATFTEPYGPWLSATDGVCGSDGSCHPRRRTP